MRFLFTIGFILSIVSLSLLERPPPTGGPHIIEEIFHQSNNPIFPNNSIIIEIELPTNLIDLREVQEIDAAVDNECRCAKYCLYAVGCFSLMGLVFAYSIFR